MVNSSITGLSTQSVAGYEKYQAMKQGDMYHPPPHRPRPQTVTSGAMQGDVYHPAPYRPRPQTVTSGAMQGDVYHPAPYRPRPQTVTSGAIQEDIYHPRPHRPRPQTVTSGTMTHYAHQQSPLLQPGPPQFSLKKAYAETTMSDLSDRSSQSLKVRARQALTRQNLWEREHHALKAFICTQCNDYPSGFRNEDELRAHTEANHQRMKRYEWPIYSEARCSQCEEYPEGFWGEHELRRHTEAKHGGVIKRWICRDPSSAGIATEVSVLNPLDQCNQCKNNKKYGAYYNAAAHLRRMHFKAKPARGRNQNATNVPLQPAKGGGNWPPMLELMKWMVEVEVAASDPSAFGGAFEYVGLDGLERSYFTEQERETHKQKSRTEAKADPLVDLLICPEPDCASNNTGFATEEERQAHIEQVHKPYQEPFDFFQPNLPSSLGLDSEGRSTAPHEPFQNGTTQSFSSLKYLSETVNPESNRWITTTPGSQTADPAQAQSTTATSNELIYRIPLDQRMTEEAETGYTHPGYATAVFNTVTPQEHLPHNPDITNVTFINPEYASELGNARPLQEHLIHKGEAAFTDSGYASAPNHSHLPRLSTTNNYPDQNNLSNTMGDDNETIYSTATAFVSDVVQKSIFNVCNSIYERLCPYITEYNWVLLTEAVPDLVKAFAITLGFSGCDELSRQIMYFAHRHHREISSQLKTMLQPDCVNAANPYRDPSQGMSLQDKMGLWGRHLGNSYAESPREPYYFEGIDEDEDDESDQAEFPTYSQAIVSSPAYEWLISSLLKETTFHWDEEQPRAMVDYIRRGIMEQLPTGKISKRRAPSHFSGIFTTPLRPNDFHLNLDNARCRSLPIGLAIGEAPVFICSSRKHIQVTTVRQYLNQTWPVGGTSLLDIIRECVDKPHVGVSIATLPDKATIGVCLEDSRLVFSASGPAYSIAERGEQISWLVAALQPRISGLMTGCTPTIEKSAIPSFDQTSQHRWNIFPQQQSIEGGIDSEFLSRASWGTKYPVLVQGYPTAARPETCAGVEIASELLFSSTLKSLLRAQDGRCFLSAFGGLLELVKQTEDLIIWRFRGCGENEDSVVKSKSILGSTALSVHVPPARFWQSRHIIQDIVNTREEDENVNSEAIDSEEPAESVKTGVMKETEQCTVVCCSLSESSQDSIDSDLFSLPVFSSEMGSEGLQDIGLPQPILDTVASRLLLEYRQSGGNSSLLYIHNTPPPNDNGTESSERTDHNPRASNRDLHNQAVPEQSRSKPPPKRSRDDGDNQDDDFRPPSSKRPRNRKISDRAKLLACPFWKQDPRKHLDCFRMKLEQVSRVKQHIARNHTPAAYCVRCFGIFKNDADLRTHMDEEPLTCRQSTSSRLDGINRDQQFRLAKKSNPKASESDRWFAMWDIIFPDLCRPSSAYLDSDLSEDLCQFREFAQSRGPIILVEQLQAIGVQTITLAEMSSHLRRVVAQGISMIFNEWSSLQPASTSSTSSNWVSTPRMPHGNEPFQNGTSVSFSRDSGVDLRSQISSNTVSSHPQLPLLASTEHMARSDNSQSQRDTAKISEAFTGSAHLDSDEVTETPSMLPMPHISNHFQDYGFSFDAFDGTAIDLDCEGAHIQNDDSDFLDFLV